MAILKMKNSHWEKIAQMPQILLARRSIWNHKANTKRCTRVTHSKIFDGIFWGKVYISRSALHSTTYFTFLCNIWWTNILPQVCSAKKLPKILSIGYYHQSTKRPIWFSINDQYKLVPHIYNFLFPCFFFGPTFYTSKMHESQQSWTKLNSRSMIWCITPLSLRHPDYCTRLAKI